jgi:L-cysteine:1D-myo-inositol 2-amino-2-deoxy-alpha-D-glucopyranoside ligase
VHLVHTSTGIPTPAGSGPTATMYVCGITPYDATHIGHAMTYVAFDLLNRAWRDQGFQVKYVQNVTDVDDPLLERAEATGVDWQQLAAEQIELFAQDMAALAVLPPDVYMGAVEGVPLVVAAVQKLLTAGHAYQVGADVDGQGHGDVYFSVHHDATFGQVSGYDRATMLTVFAERGGDPDRPGKKDPLDCLLWRVARPGEPSWDGGPLGPGRPGWHIECTTIADTYLGHPFDVQGGGNDLIFPHHEMGAAEAHLLSGTTPFARVLAHVGMVGLDGHKMSKSRGNLVFVSRLRAEGVDPAAIRLALLAHHYRSEWQWTADSLPEAQERLATWRQAVAWAPDGELPAANELLGAVRDAIAEDLNAPDALAAVDAWASSVLKNAGSASTLSEQPLAGRTGEASPSDLPSGSSPKPSRRPSLPQSARTRGPRLPTRRRPPGSAAC